MQYSPCLKAAGHKNHQNLYSSCISDYDKKTTEKYITGSNFSTWFETKITCQGGFLSLMKICIFGWL